MANSGEAAAGLVGLIWFIIIVAFGSGWCVNIYKLTQCDFEPSYKAEIIRTIGVVVPVVGGVTGWMEFGK